MDLPDPLTTNKLTLRFLSGHGGPNPGASEIQIYGVRRRWPLWAAF